jgi:hypothetical protein
VPVESIERYWIEHLARATLRRHYVAGSTAAGRLKWVYCSAFPCNAMFVRVTDAWLRTSVLATPKSAGSLRR